ncbi:MAG: glycosyltransferase family 2 protein [Planctomycetota bacterium]
MNTPDVSILIVSFNTKQLTLECLDSVYEQTRGVSFEVIVVDNASADGSADAIEATYPQARLIRSETNVGFAVANNIAAEVATGRRLLLLNSDTRLLNDAVSAVVALADKDPNPAIVGGRTFFDDGRLNPNSCHGAPTPWSMFCLGTGLASLMRRSALFHPEGLGKWERDSRRVVDAITGCFLLIDADVWRTLGGFDADFFMYGEDTDLCLRAGKLDVASVICPDARLVHHGGASDTVRADKLVRLFRAKAQLVRRHWSPPTRLFGIAALVAWAGTRAGAHGLLRAMRPGKSRRSFDVWWEVWNRRGEFTRVA